MEKLLNKTWACDRPGMHLGSIRDHLESILGIALAFTWGHVKAGLGPIRATLFFVVRYSLLVALWGLQNV